MSVHTTATAVKTTTKSLLIGRCRSLGHNLGQRGYAQCVHAPTVASTALKNDVDNIKVFNKNNKTSRVNKRTASTFSVSFDCVSKSMIQNSKKNIQNQSQTQTQMQLQKKQLHTSVVSLKKGKRGAKGKGKGKSDPDDDDDVDSAPAKGKKGKKGKSKGNGMCICIHIWATT